MREFLKGLDLDKETIDTIMAEHGKLITASKEETESLKQKVNTYETEISRLKENSKDSDDWKSKFESLDKKIKDQEIESQKQKEDEILTNNIVTAFGDKKFTSDYVKNGLISDIKTELSKVENKGKGISEIFESLTKDKQGLFENPNPPKDMPPMGNGSTTTPSNLDEMSYDQYKEWRKNN